MFGGNYLLLVLIPTMLLSLGAQWLVSSAFSRWTRVRNSAGLAGPQVAEALKRSAGLDAVRLERTPGSRSDHFDPRENVVRMSPEVEGTPSVASMAVVAHELGHAQQYQQGSFLIQMRSFLVPAMQFSPMISYALITLGLAIGMTGLFQIGVLVYGVVVVFMLLTLPVEIDASLRGLRMLREAGFMQSNDDSSGARSVLTAAALTYVAAAVSSLMTLLYYISLMNSNNRRRY